MFRRNFIERHVLLEIMFYLRICIVGGHILLLEISYWVHVLQEGISYRMICRRACISGRRVNVGHVFYESMCYGRTCEVGGYVLQVCAKATI